MSDLNESLVLSAPAVDSIPLCVDLDSTLLRIDLLEEAAAKYIIRRPWRCFQVLAWLVRGKAFLKFQLAKRVPLRTDSLPFSSRVLDLIQREAQLGRKVYLVTGSSQSYAVQVAAAIDRFTGVFASDERVNLTGEIKAEKLKATFGERGFDYAGDSLRDLAVWKLARRSIVVNPNYATRCLTTSLRNVTYLEDKPSSKLKVLKLMRPHHWTKSLLVFLPLLTSHTLSNVDLLAKALWGAVAFSLVSSGVYIANDLVDLDNDRGHPVKKHRPLASGACGLKTAFLALFLLLGTATFVAVRMTPDFASVLSAYGLISIAYIVFLKRIAILDAVTLSILYCLRILGGHCLAGIEVSLYLLCMANFMFLSLAMSKRYSELHMPHIGECIPGRGYRKEDQNAVLVVGLVSGISAITVMILYLTSPAVQKLYRRPEWLVVLIPLFFYNVARIWLLGVRGELADDPVLFALRDRVSYLILGVTALVMVLASN